MIKENENGSGVLYSGRDGGYFTGLDLADRIRAALPVARDILSDGISPDGLERRPIAVLAQNLAGGQVGYGVGKESLSEVDFADIDETIEAAYVIGIAVGMMLRPDAFVGGKS